jgi:predicted cupin superfamily sugar epimerase
VVTRLGLIPHPEGGFYREIFKSPHRVRRELPGPARAAVTAIYYLLAAGQRSRWHRVASDEQWTFLDGDPIELFTASPDGSRLTTVSLGPMAAGHDPLAIVPAGLFGRQSRGCRPDRARARRPEGAAVAGGRALRPGTARAQL